MAIGISVTGDALLGYVITVTNANTSDRVRVYRHDVSGYYSDAAIRDIDQVSPTGSTMVVTDYEAPFNTELTFTAQAFAVSDLVTPVSTATTGPINTVLPDGFAIITDPLDAGQRIAVAVAELDDWSFDTKVLGRHNVIGRHNSIINADTESGRTGQMVISNLDQFGINWDGTGPYLPYAVIAHANWNTIFRPGNTLLFRSTHQETGVDDMYFKTLGRKVRRIGAVGVFFDADTGRHNVWLAQTVSFEEQDRPSTALHGTGIGTWLQVRDNNVNWSEVNSDHADWADVLVNPGL